MKKTYIVDVELVVHAEDHQGAVDNMIAFMPEPTGTDLEGVESWNAFRVSLCDGMFSWHISECRRVEDHKVLQEEFAK
jgi:hypothetical protein